LGFRTEVRGVSLSFPSFFFLFLATGGSTARPSAPVRQDGEIGPTDHERCADSRPRHYERDSRNSSILLVFDGRAWVSTFKAGRASPHVVIRPNIMMDFSRWFASKVSPDNIVDRHNPFQSRNRSLAEFGGCPAPPSRENQPVLLLLPPARLATISRLLSHAAHGPGHTTCERDAAAPARR